MKIATSNSNEIFNIYATRMSEKKASTISFMGDMAANALKYKNILPDVLEQLLGDATKASNFLKIFETIDPIVGKADFDTKLKSLWRAVYNQPASVSGDLLKSSEELLNSIPNQKIDIEQKAFLYQQIIEKQKEIINYCKNNPFTDQNLFDKYHDASSATGLPDAASVSKKLDIAEDKAKRIYFKAQSELQALSVDISNKTIKGFDASLSTLQKDLISKIQTIRDINTDFKNLITPAHNIQNVVVDMSSTLKTIEAEITNTRGFIAQQEAKGVDVTLLRGRLKALLSERDSLIQEFDEMRKLYKASLKNPTPSASAPKNPGQTPPNQTPPGQTPPGQTPTGKTPPGQTPPGQTPPGQTPPASSVIPDSAEKARIRKLYGDAAAENWDSYSQSGKSPNPIKQKEYEKVLEEEAKKKSWNYKFKYFFQGEDEARKASKNMPLGEKLTIAWKVTKTVFYIGLAYAAYHYFLYPAYEWYCSFGEAKQETEQINNAITKSISEVEKLPFIVGSEGESKTKELKESLANYQKSLENLEDKNIPKEEKAKIFKKSMTDLNIIENYISNFENIKKDLPPDINYKESLASLEETKSKIYDRLANVEQVANKIKQDGGTENITKRFNEFNNRPSIEPMQHTQQEGRVINIYDVPVSMAGKSPTFASAVQRMSKTLLQTPIGKLAMDPDDKWGGILDTGTKDKSVDFLQKINFLYKNEIFSTHDLKAYFKKTMPRESRAKFSLFRDALQYYKQNPVISNKNNDSEEKIPNDLRLVSGNNINGYMQKTADKISKKYFKDLLTTLEDEYSKSYLTGLKGMYDKALKKNKADYERLYNTQKETGRDLILSAHPNSINLQEDSMGNGGKIENVLEARDIINKVMQTVPTGTYVSRIASVIEGLIKIAQDEDFAGNYETSNMIDDTIKTIIGEI